MIKAKLSAPSILVALCLPLVLVGCDKVNRVSRTMDTMLGGDYDVYIQGHDQVYHVKNGKVTSEAGKGYYIFYPTVDGKETMVQSPVQLTTIVKVD